MKCHIFLYIMMHSIRPDNKKIMNLKMIFYFYFLNIDNSVIIQYFELKLSQCVLNIPFEGCVSQIFYLDPSFYFM